MRASTSWCRCLMPSPRLSWQQRRGSEPPRPLQQGSLLRHATPPPFQGIIQVAFYVAAAAELPPLSLGCGHCMAAGICTCTRWVNKAAASTFHNSAVAAGSLTHAALRYSSHNQLCNPVFMSDVCVTDPGTRWPHAESGSRWTAAATFKAPGATPPATRRIQSHSAQQLPPCTSHARLPLRVLPHSCH